MSKKIPGFTLAEVLIVLGIIGIIAINTIPTLMNNVQEQQYKAAWKKAFSEINQITMQIKNENGGSLIGVFTDIDTFTDLYSNKFKSSKVCKSQGCENMASSCSACPWESDSTSAFKSTITTLDGIMYGISYIDTDCNTSTWGETYFGQNLCAEFYIDLNGYKKPGKDGEDNFWVGIGPEKIIPAGSPGIILDSYKCPNGRFCNSYKYLYE